MLITKHFSEAKEIYEESKKIRSGAELIDAIIASRIDKYQQKYQTLQILKIKNMLELFDFQEQTALKIVEKYENYLRQKIIIKKGEEKTLVPFIQVLDALTGSGKTVMNKC